MLREIYLTEFTTEKAIEFRKRLFFLANRFPDSVIRIYIDSHGGDLEALASMVASMSQIKNEIHTIAIGKAMSAGAILLSYGDERYCDKHATLMIHSVQLFDLPDMDMEEFKISEKEIKRINKFWLNNFAKNCEMTYQDLIKLFKEKGKEIYLNASQGKRLGLVDHVGVPKLRNDGLVIGIDNEKS